MKTIRVYNIWPTCPSISISGSVCQLQCTHCKGVYLRYMHQASTPEKFREITRKLIDRGAKGFLISGGCDTRGNMLNLHAMLPEIKALHDTGIVIKLHTGFVDAALASKLADAIDIASMEFPASELAIREIFRLDATLKTYIDTFSALASTGIYIAPHLCIGLYHGRITEELHAIDTLRDIFTPETLVFIVYIPTPGTPSEHDVLPEPDDVRHVISYARERMPDTNIVLGSLRPRFAKIKALNDAYIHELEMRAIEGGISGIEVPSRKTLTCIGRNFKVIHINAFGVLPLALEHKFAGCASELR